MFQNLVKLNDPKIQVSTFPSTLSIILKLAFEAVLVIAVMSLVEVR